jgi:hypothetical protein
LRIFLAGQGRTRVFGEADSTYAATGNPLRTKTSGKKTIYGWTLEAISKIGFWVKIKAGQRFNPQAYSSIPRS